MICDRCNLDQWLTVTTEFAITKYDRNGAGKRVQMSRCLCHECGAGAPELDPRDYKLGAA